MALPTSGTRSFEMEIAELINEAYELVGLETRTGYDLIRARRSLNIMLMDWANKGINLWTVERVEDLLIKGQSEVIFGDGDIDIIDCIIRYKGRDYPLSRNTRADYLNIPNKQQEQRPTEIYVERTIRPKAFIWPVPPDNHYTLISYRIQRIEDAGSNAEGVAIPPRFIKALVTGLAFQLALKAAPERAEVMMMLANDAFDLAANEDSERGSMFVNPGGCY